MNEPEEVSMTCKFCGDVIHEVIGPHQEISWVDNTDGDGCGDNILQDGTHGSHAPFDNIEL